MIRLAKEEKKTDKNLPIVDPRQSDLKVESDVSRLLTLIKISESIVNTTWSLTKATTQRLRTAHRAMERKMLKAKLKDKIPCREIRAKTNIKDVVKFAAKQKWKWQAM